MCISKEQINFINDTYVSSKGEKIINISGSDVVLLSKDKVVCRLKAGGPNFLIAYDFKFKYIDDIQLMSEEVSAVENMPEYEENVFYIVDDYVVNSLIAHGKRTIKDLYLVYEEDWSDEFDCYLSVGLRNASLL